VHELYSIVIRTNNIYHVSFVSLTSVPRHRRERSQFFLFFASNAHKRISCWARLFYYFYL